MWVSRYLLEQKYRYWHIYWRKVQILTPERQVLTTLKVYPQPRVKSVFPRIGMLWGGLAVTIHGVFFGSEYSRGRVAPGGKYANVSVLIGGAVCEQVEVVSDSEVHCVAPAGPRTIYVSVCVSSSFFICMCPHPTIYVEEVSDAEVQCMLCMYRWMLYMCPHPTACVGRARMRRRFCDSARWLPDANGLAILRRRLHEHGLRRCVV
jgi:hypothetical protein